MKLFNQVRDEQLKVTREPIFRALKSSEPEHRKQKKRSFKINTYNYHLFCLKYNIVIKNNLVKYKYK